MSKKLSYEEVKNKIESEGYKLISKEYINNRTKLEIKCDKGHIFNMNYSNFHNGQKCPVCKIKRVADKTRLSYEEIKNNIESVIGYKLLSKEYINNYTNLKIKCNKGHEYKVIYNNFLKGQRCPICSNQKALLGYNTIWDTDRWMCDLGVSEEDAKKYTHSSNKKIMVVCPDCKKTKQIQISNLYRYHSIGCSCSDGTSYPEKIMNNVLQQLGIKFRTQLNKKYFNWCDKYRYDFYFELNDKKYIIETHGEQHYIDKTNFKKSLEEQQQIDKTKKELALNNGINEYIEIDCRKSELEFIKNNIVSSYLNKLFDLSVIDWNKSEEYALTNLVKKVCNYWNNKTEEETTKDIGIIFGIRSSTITRYLNKGSKIGWSNYNGKEEIIKRSIRLSKLNGKNVGIFKDNILLGIFKSNKELERQSENIFGIKLESRRISDVCRGKQKQYKGYTFKYATTEDINKYGITNDIIKTPVQIKMSI